MNMSVFTFPKAAAPRLRSLFLHFSASFFIGLCFVAFPAKSVIAQSASDPFELARTGSAKELAALLEAHPALADTTNPEGYTLLILAAYHGHVETAALLAGEVKDIDQGSGYGTALMGAAVKGEVEVARVLLDHDADPNALDGQGNTPLTFAAMFQNEEMARLLIDHEADPTIKNKKGFSAADYAEVHKNTVLSILFDSENK